MKITLWGMWNYDNSLFNEIDVDARLNKNLLITYIMQYCADNEVLYPNPDILKMCVNAFFQARKDNYARIIDALTAEYNPIENTDRYESRIINSDTSGSSSSTGASEYNGSSTWEESGEGEKTVTETASTTNTVNNSTELQKSAYNATTYLPYEKTVATISEENSVSKNGKDTESSSKNGKDSGNDTSSFENSETTTGKRKDIEEVHAHGNIGITTNQQMINEELALRLENNIYEIIALDFENAITIPVY